MAQEYRDSEILEVIGEERWVNVVVQMVSVLAVCKAVEEELGGERLWLRG
jgi:hypothetical protein